MPVFSSSTLLLTLLLNAPAAPGDDPRPHLAELHLEGNQEALLRETARLLSDNAPLARQLGIPYLQGHLFAEAHRPRDAARAFTAARDFAPTLTPYSRYRIAHLETSQRHPEVAAGLVAGLLGSDPPTDLVPRAVPLLHLTLRQGGDCRVVHNLHGRQFAENHRRHLTLIRAWCALRLSRPQDGFELLVDLLRERRSDDVAREAAVSLLQLLPHQEVEAEVPLLVGLTFHQHREFRRAVSALRQALRQEEQLTARQRFDARYAIARSYFWVNNYVQAAEHFEELATSTHRAEYRAQARFQQGRCFELMRNWQKASDAFRTAYNEEPSGDWAGAALLSALRLEWRAGQEDDALELYELLKTRPRERRMAVLAGLFLASSDLVRGRSDRAGHWLQEVDARSREQLELSYWRGRLAELQGEPQRAVQAYLRTLVESPFHPLSLGARDRLASDPLVDIARAEGRRLAQRSTTEDLYRAWLLLAGSPQEGAVADRLRAALLAEDRTADYLTMTQVAVEEWPLWQLPLRRPDELLLGLGLWREGAAAIPRHFPIREPSLALTGATLLQRAGELRRSLLHAETLNEGIPTRVPARMLPTPFRRLLFPDAYREQIEAQSAEFQIDPNLLRAIIREESRFDADALSGAAARGLAQFTLPTARRVARNNGLGRIAPDALYDPGISIHLGAAYLSELLQEFQGEQHFAVAAYNAGVEQTRLWIGHCFSDEPEEFYTKVSFRETRNYVRKVLTSLAEYHDLTDQLSEREPVVAESGVVTASTRANRARSSGAAVPGTNPSNPP